jgi:hypothetical protein
MKIAVMQPYFFPYIGYFELIKSVDRFYFLDNVQYIKQSWMNRNRIRANNAEGWQWLIVPVENAPVETIISEIKISGSHWLKKSKKTLLQTYGKKIEDHPLFKVFDRIEDYLNPLLQNSVCQIARYLGIETPFESCTQFSHITSTGQQRVIDLCREVKADVYINSPGGRELYDEKTFADNGIELQFMEPTQHPNRLSILDVTLGDGLNRL